MKKSKLIVLLFAGIASACSTNDTTELGLTPTSNDNTIISSDILFDTPTSISFNNPESNNETTLAKLLETDVQVDIYDFYKPVPIYIYLANEAKNNVKEFINTLRASNIPKNFEADIENGLHITSKTIDTLGLEFYRVSITKEENKVLTMNYFKNKEGNYKGRFFYSDIANENLGNKAFIQFDSFNEVKKMTILYKNETGIYGEKHKDDEPTTIMLRSTKKGNIVTIKGISIHPTFTDSFLTEGKKVPSVYAFRAAANTELNRGILRAALAPKADVTDSIFYKYSLDKVVTEAGVRVFKKIIGNDEKLKLVFLPLMNITTTEEINGENLEKLLNDFPEMTQNDTNLLRFQKFIATKQPIYLQKNARIEGYESQFEDSKKIVKKEDIDNSDITEISIDEAELLDIENGSDNWIQ